MSPTPSMMFGHFGIDCSAGRSDGSAICHGNAWSIYARDIEGNPIKLAVDSPWYTPQSRGEPFALGLDDADIYRQRKRKCNGLPEASA